MERRVLGCLMICGLMAFPALGADEVKGQAGYDKGMKFVSDDGKHSVNVGARVQIRFTEEDPDRGDGKGSFDVRRAKFWLKGEIYGHWKYKLQVVFSSDQESSVDVDPGPPVAVDVESPEFAELEDAFFQYTRHRMAQPWIGQGKAFFGRQQLTSSGKQQFVDRAISDKAFVPARTQGVALVGQTKDGRWEYDLGVYDDFEGQNIRSNRDDNYMTTARVVFTPFGAYKLDESPHDYPEGPRLAVGIKGLRDTVTDGAMEEDNETHGIELAFKRGGVSVVSEYFRQTIAPRGGAERDTDGGYIQVGYLFPNRKAEVAGRYAHVSPDVAGPGEDVEERGLAFSWYFDRHNYKVQADLRRITDDGDPGRDEDEARVQAQFVF